MVLAVISTVAVMAISILGEMMYQATPRPARYRNTGLDICFVLDFSWSMHTDVDDSGYDGRVGIDIETVNTPSDGKAFARGEEVVYRVTVRNNSAGTLYNIEVTADQSNAKWQIPSLSAGAAREFQVAYTMTADDVGSDFRYYVGASFDAVPDGTGTGDMAPGKVLYELAFIHRAEEEGEVHELYIIVDEVTTRLDNLKAAFENTLNQMTDGQRVSVIIYRNEAKLIQDWCELTPENRRRITSLVNAEDAEYETSFDRALALADSQIGKALGAGRQAAAIMLSDGEDETFRSVADSAPTILKRDVRVHTVLISRSVNAPSLARIASETGGRFTTTGEDLAELTQTMAEAVETARADQKPAAGIPDTLMTERYVTRKTVINAPVLRILILLIIGFIFKIIAVICIGNNRISMGPHLLKAILIAALTACWVEFGYIWGLPFLPVAAVYWAFLMGQIVLTAAP